MMNEDDERLEIAKCHCIVICCMSWKRHAPTRTPNCSQLPSVHRACCSRPTVTHFCWQVLIPALAEYRSASAEYRVACTAAVTGDTSATCDPTQMESAYLAFEKAFLGYFEGDEAYVVLVVAIYSSFLLWFLKLFSQQAWSALVSRTLCKSADMMGKFCIIFIFFDAIFAVIVRVYQGHDHPGVGSIPA